MSLRARGDSRIWRRLGALRRALATGLHLAVAAVAPNTVVAPHEGCITGRTGSHDLIIAPAADAQGTAEVPARHEASDRTDAHIPPVRFTPRATRTAFT